MQILERGSVPDGGLSWDHVSRVVTVRLVGALESPEAMRLKEAILAEANEFTVEFQRVRYSRNELEQLADGLFSTANLWGPSRHIAGGWMCFENRVRILIPEGTGETQAWIDAIEGLGDARIVYETVTPLSGRRPSLPERE